jgi:chromosome segregation ATPase
MRAQGRQVTQQVPELDQRLAELQTQIDQLTLSLHLWRDTQDRLQPTEERLSELTERAAGILDQWTSSGARHARAIGELEVRLHDLHTLESRVGAIYADPRARARD